MSPISFFKLNTIDTLIKSFIHSFIHSQHIFNAFILKQTAYELTNDAKEAAVDLFKELTKNMVDNAALMGKCYTITRKVIIIIIIIIFIIINYYYL